LAKIIEDLIDYARDHVGPDGRRPAIADDEIARRLARARASVASLRALTYTNICEAMKTETPGPRGSIVKLMYAELAKEIGKLAMDVIGPASVRYSSRWDVDGWVGRRNVGDSAQHRRRTRAGAAPVSTVRRRS